MKVLSWDVGIINLAYCLLEIDNDSSTNKYKIEEWGLIDLSYKKKHQCCKCSKKATFETLDLSSNTMKEYCGIHIKKNKNLDLPEFEKFYQIKKLDKKCDKCNTVASCSFLNNKLCKNHARQFYKKYAKDCSSHKIKKEKTTHDIDILRYRLVLELEKREKLFQAEMVLVENQPALKNPTMKAISSTIYDFYLIRGIFDKKYQSKITRVKFMSPSNKIKLSENCQVVYHADKKVKYKITKQLAVEYVTKILQKNIKWLEHFKSFKKKDDLADALLQGAYYLEKMHI